MDHYCSVVPEKIQTLRSTIKWDTWQASFPTGRVGPQVGIPLSPLNTNDGFYLSHMPLGKKNPDLVCTNYKLSGLNGS